MLFSIYMKAVKFIRCVHIHFHNMPWLYFGIGSLNSNNDSVWATTVPNSFFWMFQLYAFTHIYLTTMDVTTHVYMQIPIPVHWLLCACNICL